jgi:hypothetical protein
MAFAGLSMYNHYILTETLRPELRGSANKAAKEGNIISNTLKQVSGGVIWSQIINTKETIITSNHIRYTCGALLRNFEVET